MRREVDAGSVRLVATAAVGGLLTGLVAAAFARLLVGGGELRDQLAAWARDHGLPGFGVVLVVTTVSVVLAAALVHRVEPHAEGSGIPHVEAVVQGHAPPGRLRIVPVKFAGGLLAIGGGGLALGREGPSVQMGGVIGSLCARAARLGPDEVRMVIAGGAAAGLATAFNAPIAGGVFVLEELLRRFDHRTTLAALAASGAGIAATHVVGTDDLVFRVPPLPEPDLALAPVVLVVAAACAVVGLLHNRALLAALRFVDTTRVPLLARASLVGVVAGTLLWVRPDLVGGGDQLTERALQGEGVLGAVLVVLVVRFAFGVLSYASNTPGGLFAPMLVLGSHVGLGVALATGQPALTAAGLALVGMAAFFGASVQAPVTGLVLATEMTGSVVWLPPMLGAVAVAMLAARLMGSPPIYDALAERATRNARLNREERRGS